MGRNRSVRQDDPPLRSSAAHHAGPAALYLLLTLYLGYGLVRHPLTHVPFTAGDGWLTFWNYWWARRAVFTLYANPFRTRYLSYPHEASLVFHSHDFLHGVLTAPLQALFPGLSGITLGVNVVILFCFFFTACTAYLSLWEMTAHRPAAIIGGFGYSFSAFHFAWLAMPVMAALYWIPLFTWLFVRGARRPGRLRWVLPGICFGLCTFQSLYYTLFLVCLIPFLGAYVVLTEPEPRRAAGRLLAINAAVIVCALPMSAIIAEDMISSVYETPGAGTTLVHAYVSKDIGDDARLSVDLLGLLVPGPQQGLWRRYSKAWNSYVRRPTFLTPVLGRNGEGGMLAYVGAIPMLLACIAWTAASRRVVALWSICALIFLALSLGPYLHVAGYIFRSYWLPLPYRLLLVGPRFAATMFHNPSSFWAPTLFAVWVLAAFGLQRLLAKRSRRGAAVTWTLLGVWLAVDYASPPLPTWPVHVPAAYFHIARDPRPVALLEVPADDFMVREAYDFFQTVHGKPIALGYLARNDQVFSQRLHQMEDPQRFATALAPLLTEIGPSYVVVHRLWLNTPAQRAVAHFVATQLGPTKVYQDRETVVYGWQLAPLPDLFPVAAPGGNTQAQVSP
jgi:hypothetical protein